MTDLDAAIRERLGDAAWQIKGCNPDLFAAIAVDELVGALTAVLNEHPHLHRDKPNDAHSDLAIDGGRHDIGCVTCHYYTHGVVWGHGWCPTVRAIAEKLGIEA